MTSECADEHMCRQVYVPMSMCWQVDLFADKQTYLPMSVCASDYQWVAEPAKVLFSTGGQVSKYTTISQIHKT